MTLAEVETFLSIVATRSITRTAELLLKMNWALNWSCGAKAIKRSN